jgi:hypothetical protein
MKHIYGLKRISPVSPTNGCQFRRKFFNRVGLGRALLNASLVVLSENSDDRVFSRSFPERYRCGWPWPTFSADLNPRDYFSFRKLLFTKTTRRCRRIARTHFSVSDQRVKKLHLQLCEMSDTGCRWSWTPLMHVPKAFLLDCRSAKGTELGCQIHWCFLCSYVNTCDWNWVVFLEWCCRLAMIRMWCVWCRNPFHV